MNLLRILTSSALILFFLAEGLLYAPQKAEAARSVTFLQFTGDATALSVHTFAGQNLGAAADDRYIFVIVHGEEKAGSITSVSVTVGGIAATTDVFRDDPGNGDIAAIARAKVPTGTTGSIVVTTNDLTGIGIGVFRASGIGTPVLSKTTSAIGAPNNLSITSPAGGLMFTGVSIDDETTPTITTGVTNSYDAAIGLSTDRSAGGFIFPAAGTASISSDNAGGSFAAGVAASYTAGTALAKPSNNLGLVGYWPMNEGTTTVASDFSGNGNKGTFSGSNPPTATSGWTNGKRGSALGFDGTNDCLDVGDISATEGQSKMTISVWLYDRSPGVGKGIVSKYTGATPGWALFTSDSGAGGSDDMEFDSDGGGESMYTTTNAHKANRWEHWVVVYDGTQGTDLGKIDLYLNGVVQSEALVNTPVGSVTGSNTNTICIGSDADTTAGINAVIDEVRIYNRALSPAEVRALYGNNTSGAVRANASSKTLTNGTTFTRGLIGLWTFDGGDTRWTSQTTGVTYDGSGNSSTGTLTNMNRASTPGIGKLGQALTFNGSNSYVTMGDVNAMDGLTKITVAAWIKSRVAGGNAGEKHPFEKSGCDGSLNGGPFELYSVDGKVGFSVYATGGAPTNFADSGSDSTTAINDGDWHLVVGKYDGTNVTIWVDGVQKLSNSSYSGVTLSSNSNSFGVGGYCNGNFSFYWDGSIDELRVYNRALTTAEILQLYRLGTAKIKP